MGQRTKRGLAIALSVLIHGVILFLVARFTIDLTSPEGTVDDGTLTMEVMSEGSQTVSVDVAPSPPAAPVAAAPQAPPAAAALPPATAVVEATPEAQPSEPETTAQDSLIAMAAQEPSSPESTEVSPTTTLQDEAPAIGAAPMIEEPAQTPAQEPNPQAEATPAAEPAEKTVAENYGVPSGAKDAKTLASSPGNRRPEYPLMARFRRIQGRTVAQFSVSGDGTVSNARIFSSDNEAFNSSVLSAVQTWKFKAPVTPGEYYWAFDFRLSGQEKEAPGRLRTK